LKEGGRRLANRQDEEGEERKTDQDGRKADDNRLGSPRDPFEDGA
jgi:hypothetical protein